MHNKPFLEVVKAAAHLHANGQAKRHEAPTADGGSPTRCSAYVLVGRLLFVALALAR